MAGQEGRGRADAGRDSVAALATLGEPTRRRIFDFVVGLGRAVGRDEVAAGLEIGRPLAAFHLDRLVRAGLLTTEYRRLGGRSGPGAGRPAKLYRRSDAPLEVNLPARRYGLASEIFAEALEDPSTGEGPSRLRTTAHDRGREAGRAARETAGMTPSAPEARKAELLEALARAGYEPVEREGRILLRNCPFDALAQAHRPLMCPTNLAYLEGLTEGFEAGPGLTPRLDRPEGWCCVTFGPDRAPDLTDDQPGVSQTG